MWLASACFSHITASSSQLLLHSTTLRPVQSFQRADPDARRCQFRSLTRRRNAGRTAELAACVLAFLGGGCTAPPSAGPAVSASLTAAAAPSAGAAPAVKGE